jgi:hypothetical protein
MSRSKIKCCPFRLAIELQGPKEVHILTSAAERKGQGRGCKALY